MVEVPDGQKPRCYSCGFGSPADAQLIAVSTARDVSEYGGRPDQQYRTGGPQLEIRASKTPLILGIIGGIFGIMGGLFAISVGSFAGALGGDDGGVTRLGWSAIAFSTLGIVGGVMSGGKPRAGGWMLIISAVGGLISISFFFILPFILLLIGGIVALVDGKKRAAKP
jgi:hypothetical protein